MLVLALSITILGQGAGDAPKPVRISSGVADGLKTHDVTPTYPRKARQKHITGDVLLRAIIDPHGKVIEITVLQGDSILADASINAVKQWRFRPFILNGQPVIVDAPVKIQFHM